MLKALSLFALVLSVSSSFAVMPIDIPDRKELKAFEAAEALEEKMGSKLSDKDFYQLTELIKNHDREESTVARVSDIDTDPRTAIKSIYCVGAKVALIGSKSVAFCVNPESFQTYTIEIVGLGFSYETSASIFTLQIAYDSSRYDTDFDPIPGSYGVASVNLVIIQGLTKLFGNSGNKKLMASGVTFGLAVDALSGSHLVIK